MIPEYVATLGRSSAEPPTPEQRYLLENHLSHRLRQGFDVDEVVVEFSVLVRVLHELLDRLGADERPSEQDVACLFHELHAATGVVTSIYAHHLRDDEQMEKRYARLIQEVVSHAVHSDDGGAIVRRRLAEILELVREALGGDAAALFSYDSEGRCLLVKASTGLPHATDDAGVPLSHSSFVGEVALERKTVVVRDTDDTRFEPAEPLRRAAMRSLIGVPLETAKTLIGVLVVADRGVRDFTPSDVRRLESLGDRIALHLDNAQLSTRLRDKIAQLELFVDVLAHDLRGPLTTARIAAEMLRAERLGRAAPLAKLDRSLRRMERMVTDLLDAHRIAAGEALPLRVRQATVDGVVAEAVDELEAGLRARVVVPAIAPTHGSFDAELVRRAVWNLLVNALKYGAPEAPVEVDIQGDDRGFVVAVHNQGPAISLAAQEVLFKPFARVRGAHAGGSATPVGPHGWGLGLSLVAGCAAAHGGSVGVESGADGTTFRLTIPWQTGATQEAAPAIH